MLPVRMASDDHNIALSKPPCQNDLCHYISSSEVSSEISHWQIPLPLWQCILLHCISVLLLLHTSTDISFPYAQLHLLPHMLLCSRPASSLWQRAPYKQALLLSEGASSASCRITSRVLLAGSSSHVQHAGLPFHRSSALCGTTGGAKPHAENLWRPPLLHIILRTATPHQTPLSAPLHLTHWCLPRRLAVKHPHSPEPSPPADCLSLLHRRTRRCPSTSSSSSAKIVGVRSCK